MVQRIDSALAAHLNGSCHSFAGGGGGGGGRARAKHLLAAKGRRQPGFACLPPPPPAVPHLWPGVAGAGWVHSRVREVSDR